MIQPKKHYHNFERPKQLYETRLDDLRLDYNELVPHLGNELFQEIISQMRAEHFTAYPEMKPAYEALSEYLGVPEDNLILTSGSDSAIRQILETFCYEGDEIITTFPTYGMYMGYSEIMNLNCIKIGHLDDFTIDTDQILATITNNTKIIAIANPNGNTGSIIPKEKLETIILYAQKRDVLVLLDQAYCEYYKDDWGPRINEFENLVLVRTFSKSWGIAGLRYGYILTNKILRSYIYKAKPVVETNSVAVFAASYLLKYGQDRIKKMVEETKAGKEYLAQQMEELGYRVYRGYANFIQVFFGEETEMICKELAKRKIGIKYNGDQGVLAYSARITVGPVKEMQHFVKVLKEVCSCFKQQTSSKI